MAVSTIKKFSVTASRSWGSWVDITTQTSRYTIPSDGYVKLECNYRAGSYIRMRYAGNETLIAQLSAPNSGAMIGLLATLIPVYKGLQIRIDRESGNYSRAHFIPLIENYK